MESLVAEHPLREGFSRQLMLALYRSGRQAEASNTYQRVRERLVEGARDGAGCCAQQMLKAILNQDASLVVAPRHEAGRRKTNNLPLLLTNFVGRGDELEQVKRLLSKHRLITLTGAGGVGKTRLSIQVAHELVNGYRDGTWLVELAPTNDPAAIPQVVATVLGVREQAGRPMVETLVDYLESRHILMLLDNCEHLVSAVAILTEVLLRHCPELRVLATSREALGISGELALAGTVSRATGSEPAVAPRGIDSL